MTDPIGTGVSTASLASRVGVHNSSRQHVDLCFDRRNV